MVERKSHGLLLAGIGVAVLSVDALMVKLPKGATAWEKVLVRYGAYGAGMCAWAGVERLRYGEVYTRWCREHVYGGVCMSVTNLCFVNSLQRTDAAVTLGVLASAPLWAALLGRLLLGEATPPHTLLACVLGSGCVLAIVLGTTTSSSSSSSSSTPTITTTTTARSATQRFGALLALVAAAGISCFSIACRAFYRRSVTLPREGPGAGLPPPQSILPALALSGVLDVAAALAFGAWPSGLSSYDINWLVFQGLAVLPISFTLISWGTKHLLGAETMLVMLMETALGPLWVYVVLGEAPCAATLWGGVALLLVLTLNGWVTLREEQRAQLGGGSGALSSVVPIEAVTLSAVEARQDLADKAADHARPCVGKGRSTTREQRLISTFIEAEERELAMNSKLARGVTT